MEKKFKYIKKFNEDIDWSWIDEEEDNFMLDDFKGYEKFYNFLKENDALEKWVNNFDPEYHRNNCKTIKEFLKTKHSFKYIFDAFFTSFKTPESFYWLNIHKKWMYRITIVKKRLW